MDTRVKTELSTYSAGHLASELSSRMTENMYINITSLGMRIGRRSSRVKRDDPLAIESFDKSFQMFKEYGLAL